MPVQTHRNQCTHIWAHSSAIIPSRLAHNGAQPEYGHISSFSSSLCPTVFVIIPLLKLSMLFQAWCIPFSLSLSLVCLSGLSPFPFFHLKDNRSNLIHLCMRPPVPENDTTPESHCQTSVLLQGQGSAALLIPLQVAAPCWSQWEMPARPGHQGQMPR